ncbi:MAG: helix-turn-helix domain-containing protein [Bacteriovoracaceae bacterium]|nr:helix-turn-helix domain-containing protein [Bacteriovoracaceae bacterium]
MKVMIDIVTHIEDHLSSDLSVRDVSEYSGYSTHHFQKMFAAVTGLSLGSYIRRRRLTTAANKLKHSSERIIEVALGSGFESQEAFTRAFKKMFGATPNKYRKSSSDFGLRKLEAITTDLIGHLRRGVIDMKPKYQTREDFYVIGPGKVFERANTDEIGNLLWPEFLNRFDEIPNKLGKIGDSFITYGICKEIWKENHIQDHFNYYAGVEVEKETTPPQGMELIYIPKQKYAVFTHHGGVNDLNLTNQYIWGSWLPQSGHKLAPASDLEVYPAEFKPESDESQMEIWIPLQENPKTL